MRRGSGNNRKESRDELAIFYHGIDKYGLVWWNEL